MLRCLLFILIATAIAMPAVAQPVADSSSRFPEAGTWALQFRIVNTFTLTSFTGANISLKRHTQNQKAFRLGVSILANQLGTDEASTTVQDRIDDDMDAQFTVTNESLDRTTSSLDITAHYLHYVIPKNNVSLFVGGGPTAGFSLAKDDTETVSSFLDSLQTVTTQDVKVDGWNVGAEFVIGAEWFVSPQISFFAEYGTALQLFQNGKSNAAR